MAKSIIDGLLFLGINLQQVSKAKYYQYGSKALGTGGLYMGQMDQNQVPNGLGREIQHGGSIYEGQFKDGIPNGWGREFYPGGRYYVGCWKAGDYHGFGQRFEPSGEHIETGWFKESKVADEQFSISTVHYNTRKRPEDYAAEEARRARSDIDFMEYSSFYGRMYRQRSSSRGYRAVEDRGTARQSRQAPSMRTQPFKQPFQSLSFLPDPEATYKSHALPLRK